MRTMTFAISIATSIAISLALSTFAHARPHTAPPVLTDLAMPAGDDARKAIAIGPSGEVYEPDGKGAWMRERAVTMSDPVMVVGRANGIVALADGAVYRLAPNGWSALRLVQKGKAVMSSGARSVAAVGRQLFALDKLVGGEVAKLAMAPRAVQQIGAGAKGLTIQTERGLLHAKAAGAAWKPIARAPRRVDRLIDDRWALDDRGVIDLKTGKRTAWPGGFRFGAATPGPKGTLMLVGTHRGAIEVVVIEGVKATRETVEVTPDSRPGPDPTTASNARNPDAQANAPSPTGPLSNPVGVVTDKSGRVVIAFRDGRLAIRERGTWSVTAITEALPAARPGAPPATSP